MITSALILMLGGALGAVARYQTTRIIARIHPSARFPLATLLINLTGSALLGALLGLLSSSPAELTQTPLYLLFGAGFCGAFTTFSTFAVETRALLHHTNSQKSAAAAYLILTITGCLALFILCFTVAVTLSSPNYP